MKKIVLLLLLIGITMNVSAQKKADNPFFKEYNTPYQVPPFDKIKEDHYLPAFEKGFEEAAADLKKIIDNKAEPNFKNTVEALEFSGELLSKVSSVFFNLSGSNSTPRMQEIAQDVSPKLSKYSDDIILNEELFKKISAVYEKRHKDNLNREQIRLVENYYDDFVKNGAMLSKEQKDEISEINQALSLLYLKFRNNVLSETNNYKLYIEDESQLSGLPESIRASAKQAATRDKNPNKWLFTLHNPSVMPFLQYADDRELRRQLWDAYVGRANNDNEYDNKEAIREILMLSQRKANILGFDNYSNFVLSTNMAKDPETVFSLLNQLWSASLPNAIKEAEMLQDYIRNSGEDFEIMAWDWRYYAEKLRKEQYDLDDEEIRPYLSTENVMNGAFYVADRLWGIKFKELNNVPKYDKTVKVFEVTEKDGKHIGLFFADYYNRPSKRGGAWMNSLRSHKIKDGKTTHPIIFNVCNFPAPVGNTPSLLTIDEAETLFHEFGHALHGLFANNAYPSIGGTSVPRDFVELPSQVMEHWFAEPEVMKVFAKHYQTGEPIPDELVRKIQESSKFNQGFATTEFLASALLDMHYYTLDNYDGLNSNEFEERVSNEIGLIHQIPYRHRSTYFQHIFTGGYSSQYYSYIWAGVLDADAFEAFKETSIFDQKTAESLRRNILEKGHTADPMDLYRTFRGREPSIEPLLKNRGLK